MPRARLVDSAAALSRREAFLGPVDERTKLARALIRLGAGTAQADFDAVLEHVKKIPQPLLRRLGELELEVHVVRGSVAEHHRDLGGARPPGHPPRATWKNMRTAFSAADREVVIATGAAGRNPRSLAPPPGALLLRELGRAVDALCGDVEPPSASLCGAQVAEREKLDGFLSRPDPIGLGELFADLFSRYYRGDPKLRVQLPALADAFDAIIDRWAAQEEAKNHPDRLRRITWFLRKHVFANPKLSVAARDSLAERAPREPGPWDRKDLERHLLGATEENGQIWLETRWGRVPYPVRGDPDPEERRARCEAFFRTFVRDNPRIGRETKARIESKAQLVYGPWSAANPGDHIKAMFERGGRVLIKTEKGDDPLDG